MAKQRRAKLVREAPIESPVAPSFEADELFELQPVTNGMVRAVFTAWHHSARTDHHERRITAYMLVHMRSLADMVLLLQEELAKRAPTKPRRGRPPGSKNRKRRGRPSKRR